MQYMLEGKPFYKYTCIHENCMVYAGWHIWRLYTGIHECKLILQLKPQS